MVHVMLYVTVDANWMCMHAQTVDSIHLGFSQLASLTTLRLDRMNEKINLIQSYKCQSNALRDKIAEAL